MLTFLLSANCLSQPGKDFRNSINTEFDSLYENCRSEIPNMVTASEARTEFWHICEKPEEKTEIIRVESYVNEVFYQEIYYIKNGLLTYAVESETFCPVFSLERAHWNCEFYFENGELVDIMSLGHGKTEDEEWDPVTILDMYRTRKEELDRVRKATKKL